MNYFEAALQQIKVIFFCSIAVSYILPKSIYAEDRTTHNPHVYVLRFLNACVAGKLVIHFSLDVLHNKHICLNYQSAYPLKVPAHPLKVQQKVNFLAPRIKKIKKIKI